MENDDTDFGGETLSVEQAASAYVKATSDGADNGQPDEDLNEQGEEADDELQASDEDEGETEEGEPDDEGQSDEDDDQEQESDQGRFVAANGKVRLPDGTVSTVADLIQGNLRDRDYRQKTMELAPQRRAVEEQSAALKASEQQVNQQREYLSQLLESITPQPPNADLMNPQSQSYDPLAYMHQKTQHEQFAQHLHYIQQTMGVSQQQMQEQAKQQRAEQAKTEWERLQGVLPELRDQAKLKVLVDELNSTAQAYGYSPSEVAESLPYDHRMTLVLRDAARWRKLQASKPKAVAQVQGRPPVQKGGKRLSHDAKRAQRTSDAVNRLKQTGTVEDAARAYLASMKG